MKILFFIIVAILLGFLIKFYRGISKKNAEQALGLHQNPYEANVSSQDFEDMVLETSNKTPVLVDFFATWCGPCQSLTPLLSEMSSDYKGQFLLAKIDVDKNRDLSERYSVRAMPTVMLFRNGECVDQFTGAKLPHSIKFFLANNGVQKPKAKKDQHDKAA